MGAALFDRAMIEDDDLIGVGECSQPMREQQDCRCLPRRGEPVPWSPGRAAMQRADDGPFRLDVDRREGIVQNEHAGVAARALSKLPTAHVTRTSGPRGWSEAVFEYVGGLLLTRGENQPGSQVTDRADVPSHRRPP